MTTNISCFLNMYEAEPAATNLVSSIPICNIDFRNLYRYQLKLPPKEGVAIVIEDVVTPEQRTSLRVPIVFPLSMWRELYLLDALQTLNLDSFALNFLKPRIAEAAISLAQRNENKGFAMVIELGIFKTEYMSENEASAVARELIKMESGSKIKEGKA